MENLGPTIKQIRLNKGLTQAAVYSGIVSRSFAIRFESGRNDIGAIKLFAILDNLAISADELRFIHDHYQVTPFDQAFQATERFYEQQNFPALTAWIHTHQTSPHSYERLVASYMQIKVLAFDHRQLHLTAAIQPAVQHLQTTPTWTLHELKLANLLVGLTATENGLGALPALTEKMVTSCQHYLTPDGDPFNVLQCLLEFYSTLLQVELNFHDFQAARALKTKFMAVDADQLTWDGRLSQQTLLGLWELYFGDVDRGNRILAAITAVEQLYQPFPDTNLRSIIQVRRLEAQAYRLHELKEN